MAQIHIRYLNYRDVQALEMTDQEILAAVEGGLLAQGRRGAVGSTPDELGLTIRTETSRWADVIRKQGVKAD